ncbi:MAG TPA: Wzz/FepE/Etk N-terminal domain-containing protein [Myxococcota bacterium]|nr:Wzz/FepE/Etk N-terminal domain-containing protein [Myxococcota bacterium]
MTARDIRNETGVSLGDLAGIFRRRMWFFLIPAVLGLLISGILALSLPPEYEGVATVTVEPQVIPKDLAPSTIEAKTENRYENLKLQLLARDSLSSIITDFKLYENSKDSREDQVESLRKQISLDPLPPAIVDPRKPVELNSFKISFRHRNPKTAAEVANRLARDFISANLRDRTALAESTTEFFEQQLQKARADLADIARQVSDYKENYQGELPEQLSLNRERLERNRIDLATTESKAEGARDQVRLLTQQLQEYRTAAANDQTDPSVRKSALELELNRMLSAGKTEKYPDVVRTRAEIAALEQMIAARQDQPVTAAQSREEIAMRDKLRDYEVEQSVLSGEIERLKADIAEYEQRIENTPRRAAELDHLEAQYKNITEAIRTLQLKKVDADIGRTMETTSKGERFRVVESAELPTSPISPNRPVWFIAGTLIGMLIGLGALVVREMSDQSYHSVVDLQNSLGLPVLAAVPVLDNGNGGERRRLLWWSRV